MDKNQISRGAHAGTPFTFNRQLALVRTVVLASLMAISLMLVQSGTSANQSLPANRFDMTNEIGPTFVKCSECWTILNQCLENGGGGSCYPEYYDCLGSCEVGR